MGKTRPTAVNLFWAIERMRDAFQRNKHLDDVERVKKALSPKHLRSSKKTSPRIAPSVIMVGH